jgi:hypothetical protein
MRFLATLSLQLLSSGFPSCQRGAGVAHQADCQFAECGGQLTPGRAAARLRNRLLVIMPLRNWLSTCQPGCFSA